MPLPRVQASPERRTWHQRVRSQANEREVAEVRSLRDRDAGTGPDSGGQPGNTQGLSDIAEAGSDSVLELVEDGQSFEAEAVGGVEDAAEPDVAEVHTKEVRKTMSRCRLALATTD